MTGCKKDYSEENINELTFFQRNVCLNKRTLISSIAIMFLFAVLSGMIKKKMNKQIK